MSEWVVFGCFMYTFKHCYSILILFYSIYKDLRNLKNKMQQLKDILLTAYYRYLCKVKVKLYLTYKTFTQFERNPCELETRSNGHILVFCCPVTQRRHLLPSPVPLTFSKRRGRI